MPGSQLSSLEPLQRVAVVGTSCSGKTTLAGRLAGRLASRHIELDALHWQPNWTPAPRETFRAAVGEAVAAERWVLDGNYSAVRDIVWPRATAVIWLNYSFPLTFYRALTRTIRRCVTREPLFAGNRESFRQAFLCRDSILLWVLKTYHRRRRQYPQLFHEPQHAHLHIMELIAPEEAERLLNGVARLGQQDGTVRHGRPPMAGHHAGSNLDQ